MIHPPFTNVALWIGIAFCIVQTRIFSGLDLALFSVSRLRLEIEAAGGNGDAVKMLSLRADSNFTLATILWGNVATNVLLTLLSESVLAGVGAFVFSTVAITLLGEIIPQAYFSRKALRIAARFALFLKFYQVMLFAVAKPTALFLNWWLGPESIALLRERDFRALLSKHVEAEGTDVGRLEATGAQNFLDLDDIAVLDEGEPVDPRSIISLPIVSGWPVWYCRHSNARRAIRSYSNLMLPEESGLFLLTTLDRRAWFWTLTIFCAMSSSTKSRSARSPIGIARSSSPA